MATNWFKTLSLEAICRRHSGSSARLEVREGREDGREGGREREKDRKRERGRGARGMNSKHAMPTVNEGRDHKGMNQSKLAGGRRGRGGVPCDGFTHLHRVPLARKITAETI